MLVRLSFFRDRPALDPLTQTIELLRPNALTWKEGEMPHHYALGFPGHEGVAFSFVTRGSCRLGLPDTPPISLSEGDFLLLAAPPYWTLAAGNPAEEIDFLSTFGKAEHHSFPGQAGAAHLIGGHFGFDDANAGLLTILMPPVTLIRASDGSAARLRSVLGLVADEVASGRPGRSLVVAKLLEILLVEAMRHGETAAGPIRRGLLAGLQDRPVAVALRALHADIRRSWTIAELAAVAGTSRSVLAERFHRLVGLPPIDYLQRWRMALAKDALRAGRKPLTEIAFACGYNSASAFSTAFRRIVGCSPARFAARRRARDAEDVTSPAPL